MAACKGHELYAQHTDIVFWPSAYGGGMPIRGYAKLYHYNIVPAGWGDITDTRGLVPSDHTQVRATMTRASRIQQGITTCVSTRFKGGAGDLHGNH